MVQCAACEGSGCAECNESGGREITSCPQALIGPETQALMRLVMFADKGLMPIAGGVLDQTQWFIDACEQVWSQRQKWEEAQLERLKQKNRART